MHLAFLTSNSGLNLPTQPWSRPIIGRETELSGV